MPPIIKTNQTATNKEAKKCTPYQIIQWNDMYKRLEFYKEEHGNCNVPNRFKGDHKLGNWVHYQRKLYKSNKLCDYRINKLNSIGFVFNVAQKEAKYQIKPWDNMFNRLVSYKQKYGNSLVPQNYKEDTKLADWVKCQRFYHNTNELSIERTDKLKGIGFEFDVCYSGDEQTTTSDGSDHNNNDCFDHLLRKDKYHHDNNGTDDDDDDDDDTFKIESVTTKENALPLQHTFGINNSKEEDLELFFNDFLFE